MEFKPQNFKRIIIKVGSSLLTDNNGLNAEYIQSLCALLSKLKFLGKDVILVSSGAVAAGKLEISDLTQEFPGKVTDSLPYRQALSSIGQPLLINIYKKYLDFYHLRPAQVLISESNVHSRQEFLNLQGTLHQLLTMQSVIPIINENDSVATKELCFGDNDSLAGAVLSVAGADLLVFLTTVDGFMVKGKKIDFLNHITKENLRYAGGPAGYGTGGMKTKLLAARTVMKSGASAVILNGKNPSIVLDFLEGKKDRENRSLGTFVSCKKEAQRRRKRWMLFGKTADGKIIVDSGAEKALVENNTSLLAVGIKKLEGNFKRGDLVQIVNLQGDLIAKGITNYDRENLDKIKGKLSSDFKKILLDKFFNEVIHKDNLILA